MTRDEAARLELDFNIRFPAVYRNAITDACPFSRHTEELDTEFKSLQQTNQEFRQEDPWGFPWQPHYWCIGGDGSGGFYFIDTQQDDATVYYCDHEAMPESIDDVDSISVKSFEEFIDDVLQLELDFQQWNAEMKQRVANRKWWQFWIPRQWPSDPED